MKFYLRMCLVGSLLVIWASNEHILGVIPPKKPLPAFLKNYQIQMKNDFKKPENVSILFSFFTGHKEGISSYTKKSFQKMNLSYLFTPSGLHLSSFMFLIMFFFNFKKSIRKKITWTMNICLLFISPFYSLQRLGLLKILNRFKLSSEKIFYASFIISFGLGHFALSPMSFIYSFFYIGTYLSFSLSSKMKLILALFSTQVILGIYFGADVSLVAISLALMGSFIFSLIFPLLIIFFSTYWFIPLNWGEPLIRIYVLGVHFFARFLNGTFISASFFMLLASWLLLIRSSIPFKRTLFTLCLLLHSGASMPPTILHS